MTPLQTRIAAVRKDCQEVIRLGKGATAGEWRAGMYDFETTRVYGSSSCRIADVPSIPGEKAIDARFIAHSRTVCPAAARVTLGELDYWEEHLAERRLFYFAEQRLTAICDNWEKETI